MSVYMIAMYDLTDEQTHLEYALDADRIMEKHNGRLLGATTDGLLLEGDQVGCGVVINFPTREDAMAFYNDADYQALKPIICSS